MEDKFLLKEVPCNYPSTNAISPWEVSEELENEQHFKKKYLT